MSMDNEMEMEKGAPKKNILYWFDSFVKRFIPNANFRAILYLSVIFVVVMYMQIVRISSPVVVPEKKPVETVKQETVIADDKYWAGDVYKTKLKNQTVDSFTGELTQWLNGKDQEFSKRKFEDILFVNGGLGGDLTTVVPESFNYLENQGRARYQYVRDKGFLNDKASLVKLGTLTCAIDDKTDQVTDVEIYDWRYADMTKLAAFMKSKPDWKVQVGKRIFDVSDPQIEDKDILALRNSQNQPVGLFSFLIFRYPQSNRIVLADSTILDSNGVDAKLTLSRIGSHWDKQPKLYFKDGLNGCKEINTVPQIFYGQSD